MKGMFVCECMHKRSREIEGTDSKSVFILYLGKISRDLAKIWSKFCRDFLDLVRSCGF
ncbi:hypothetical protein HanXRQr2_Chr08g0345911 [Helianthus annuus]|uniref:Uncharacterized protein n=1 Tax=Helianthus annuus TaxID=4232 RepID=A0A9K3IGA5_HELAN|nr:hypothetical protein HanXRQr2_Chr08g0345911 [Helianthus annuus]KAJ0902216.1 hypothetical protein HanPSC8_Chr08g0334351 [Helianthus annuus]